jgi:membrane protease YdiL (CAAX protease family)
MAGTERDAAPDPARRDEHDDDAPAATQSESPSPTDVAAPDALPGGDDDVATVERKQLRRAAHPSHGDDDDAATVERKQLRRSRPSLPEARVVPARGVLRQVLVILAIAGATLLFLWGVAAIDLWRDWVVALAQLASIIGGIVGIALQPTPRRLFAKIAIQQWRAIDAETDRSQPAPDPHLRVLIVGLAVAISLTVQEYVGGADKYQEWFPYDGDEYWELWGFVWWTGWRVFGYVVIPVIAILCLPGERVRDYYISAKGFFRHLWIYGLMFVAFSPIVIIASLSDSFRETYPFYRMANRSQFDLWAWEGLYVIQFMALEFFFRGFMLQSLRRVLGANAIFVMIVPYCMIHYGKPMPETFGAIGAGLVLGTLAMRTRSIWGGVLIHAGVAISMDVLALRGCPPIGSDEFCH